MSDAVILETDYAEHYTHKTGFSWEDTNIEVMRTFYERCQAVMKKILENSHSGRQGRHNKWDTIRLHFIKSEAMPFIARGTPHLITPEDWDILDLPSGKEINNNKAYVELITSWEKKRLTQEDDGDETSLKQTSILEWLARVQNSRGGDDRVLPCTGKSASQTFK